MLSDAFGPLQPVADQIPETYRPYFFAMVLTLASLVLVAQIVNPIVDLIGRVAFAIRKCGEAIAKLFKKKSVVEEGQGPGPLPPIPKERTIWEMFDPTTPIYPISVDRKGIPIVTIANAKGGVGKTTTTANLAAYFKEELAGQNKKVLVIDFDYQGSLTQCLTGESRITDTQIMTSHSLLLPGNPPEQILLFAREMKNGLDGVYLYAAEYPLATVENNVMIEWAKNPQSSDDVRYRLCKILRSPAFQEKFGIVLIDVPPRLTTSTINALCASTHVIIPTTLDAMSADAAGYFLVQLDRMKDKIFPTLNIVAVTLSKVMVSTTLGAHEQRAVDRLKKYGKDWTGKDDLVLVDAPVPTKSEIAAEAGMRVAYLHRRGARTIYKRLGDALRSRFK